MNKSFRLKTDLAIIRSSQEQLLQYLFMDQEHKSNLAAALFSQSWNKKTVEELLGQIEKDRSLPSRKKPTSPLALAIQEEKEKAGRILKVNLPNLGSDE